MRPGLPEAQSASASLLLHLQWAVHLYFLICLCSVHDWLAPLVARLAQHERMGLKRYENDTQPAGGEGTLW